MLKPVCVGCQCFYRPEKNGYAFLEGMPKVDGAPAGLAAPELWKPYKLWIGDKWKCPGCEHEIVVGFGRGAISEHFHKDFKEWLDKYPPQMQVNDC